MLKALWHGSRAEAAVYLVTAGTIIVTDLIVGVPVGMVAAFIYFVYEMSRLDVEAVHLAEVPHEDPEKAMARCPAVVVMRIEGPLFFASGFHLRNLVHRLNGYRCVIFDMADVPFLDVTGAEILEESIELLQQKGVDVLLARPSPSVHRKLQEPDAGGAPCAARLPGLRRPARRDAPRHELDGFRPTLQKLPSGRS